MLVALLGVVAAPARPAAAAPDGQLTVRAIASACGFRNLTTQLDVCLDLPGVWYPSEVANFWAIQNGGPNTPDCDITQVTEAAANIGPTPTSTGVFECNGRDHDTANLLASIFTGTANGHPDIPASLPAEWGVRQSNTCTVSRALLTDLSGGTCGVGATGYSQGDWYVLEGYLYLPQVASGQVTIRASNLDFGGTARAEYVAFMISSDDKLENLQFLGEAQTAFQREALIDFTIPVGDDVGASCASDVRAFRLFLFDNTDASAATLTWDIGDGFEEIPSSAFGTSADQAEICAPPTASDDADTTSRGIPVTIDVLSNDAPGDPSYPLVPTSVQLIDPSTSNPVSSVTVPGEGTWTVDPLTGEVTFSPVPDFTGVTTPVDYIVKDTLDQTAEAQIVVTVVGAYDDRSDGNVPGSAVSVPVLGNDAGVLDPGTVRIVDPATGDPVTVLVVPGEGRWSVDSGTGVITFVPEVGFTGNPTPIGYTVEDVDGNLTGATVTVTYQSAVVDVAPDTGGSGVAGGDDGPPSSSDNLLRGRLADTGGIGIRLIGVAVLLLVGGAFLLGASRRRMT